MADTSAQIAELTRQVNALSSRLVTAESTVRLLRRDDELVDNQLVTLRRDLANVSDLSYPPVSRPLLTEIVLYVRPAGNDTNDGRTEGTAVLTLKRALELVPACFEDRRYVIDITGCTEATVGVDSLAAKVSSIGWWQNFDDSFAAFFDESIMAWSGDYYRGALTIRAVPSTVVSGVALSANTAGTVHGMYSVTTTSNFTLNQHKGKLLVGSGFAEIGNIVSNTAGPNSVIVTDSTYPFTAPLTICDYGADLTLGDTSDQVSVANDSAMWCSLQLTGIRFKKGVGASTTAALKLATPCYLGISQCELQGAEFSGGGACLIETSYINAANGTEYLSGLGFGIYLRNCHLRGMRDGTHGDGSGTTNRGWCVFEACYPQGHGGTSQANHSFSIDNCDFISPVTVGVVYKGPYHCRVKDCTFNGGTYAIETQYIGSLQVDNVRGAVGTAGILLADGVQLQLLNMSNAIGVKGPGTERIRIGTTNNYIAYDTAPASPFARAPRWHLINYADNAAALAGGLVAGDVYRIAGAVMVVT